MVEVAVHEVHSDYFMATVERYLEIFKPLSWKSCIATKANTTPLLVCPRQAKGDLCFNIY